MKQLILNIEGGKFKAFLNFIKTLDYVSMPEEDAVPQWQEEEVSKRLEQIENGDMSTRLWSEAQKDIFKK